LFEEFPVGFNQNSSPFQLPFHEQRVGKGFPITSSAFHEKSFRLSIAHFIIVLSNKYVGIINLNEYFIVQVWQDCGRLTSRRISDIRIV
jgi:hypothetical protein